MFLEDVSGLTCGSHKKVLVKCDFEASEKCTGDRRIQYKDAMHVMQRNSGKFICLYCSRRLKFSGRLNPNCKHPDTIDDFFYEIDTEEKAYILGFIAADGHVSKATTSVAISIDKRDLDILEKMRNVVSPSTPIVRGKREKKRMVSILLHSIKMQKDICRHMKIVPGKKSDCIQFPDLDSDFLTWAFIRGFFDGDGCIKNPKKRSSPECDIASNSHEFLKHIGEFSGIKYRLSVKDSRLYYGSTNALDFMSKLYDGAIIFMNRKRDRYVEWSVYVPAIMRGEGIRGKLPKCRWYKADNDAIAPYKHRSSDIGFDLSIIKEHKRISDSTTLYDTGIKLRPDFGYYMQVVPRSSLGKSGYMFTNSIGIIDPSYKGTILISLTKIDPEAPAIEFPFRCVQLIITPTIHAEMVQRPIEELDESSRGEGGFGSTIS